MDIYTPMFIVELFIIPRAKNNPNVYQGMNGQRKCDIYYNYALKGREILPFTFNDMDET